MGKRAPQTVRAPAGATETWPSYPLGELFEIARGGSPRPIKDFITTDPDGINWIKIGDATLDGKYIFSTEGRIKPEGVRRSRMVKEGDFILSNSMSFGRPYILKTNGCIHDGWLLLRPLTPAVNEDYLYHVLSSDIVFEQFDRLAAGSIVRNLNTDSVRRVRIPVPPLPEQHRIVAILDKAFAAIATAKANTEKNLQNAHALFESHLQSVFTIRGKDWVEDKLQSLTTKIGSGATPLGGEESYKSQGVSLIRSLNVHDMGFRYEKLAFLDDAQANELSNVVVERRDVLLNITGASVARCCLAPDEVLPARVNQHVSIIRPIVNKLSPEFLHYLLISTPYKTKLLQTGEEGGSTRQAITKAQIQEFRVSHPKLIAEQSNIVAKLDTLSAETQRLTSLYQQKLTALSALKKSLLHHAFTGQI